MCTLMSQPSYRKPPITEAIIQIQFKNSVDTKLMGKALKKFRTLYPNYKTLKNLNVKVNVKEAGSKPDTDTDEDIGHLFASSDFSQQLSIWDSKISDTQLAPYSGWEAFIERFRKDFNTWRKVIGFQEVKQIGVRYINRIDMPIESGIVEHETYLNLYPAVPGIINPIFNQAVQVMSELTDIKSTLRINSAMVESPLPNHLAIIIDQDIVSVLDPPQSEKEIVRHLNAVRTKKNDIFEACITDKSRELFK